MEKAEFKKSSSVVDSIMIFDGVNAVKAGSAVSSNNNFINFFLSRIMKLNEAKERRFVVFLL